MTQSEIGKLERKYFYYQVAVQSTMVVAIFYTNYGLTNSLYFEEKTNYIKISIIVKKHSLIAYIMSANYLECLTNLSL
jgi:hypothetical protein